jgi:cyclic beta-1,2-glucan synthetase
VLGAALLVDPCVPKSWPGFEIAFRHHSATYEIRVDNPQGVSRGIASATLDGKALPGAQPRFKLDDDGKTHSVHIVLGDVLASVGETG